MEYLEEKKSVVRLVGYGAGTNKAIQFTRLCTLDVYNDYFISQIKTFNSSSDPLSDSICLSQRWKYF